ncbi:MAG: M1 family peptidase, partial [Chitinophagaceae bacterium]|nr:M1 family peptidase [Chitinophagaceae bacterium]
LNKDFYHQTVTSAQVEQYISTNAGYDFSLIFNQYLRTTQVPVFEYRIKENSFEYRLANCTAGLKIPVRLSAGKEISVVATTDWQESQKYADWFNGDAFALNRNFYLNVRKVE